jgi:hypothetical protein
MGTRTAIARALDQLIETDAGLELQIKLKHDLNPAPLGPGKIERIVITNEGHADEVVYKMFVPAGFQQGKNVTQMILPIVFSGDDILWFSEGPLNAAGEKVVTTTTKEPHPGNRSPSGLITGRG